VICTVSCVQTLDRVNYFRHIRSSTQLRRNLHRPGSFGHHSWLGEVWCLRGCPWSRCSVHCLRYPHHRRRHPQWSDLEVPGYIRIRSDSCFPPPYRSILYRFEIDYTDCRKKLRKLDSRGFSYRPEARTYPQTISPSTQVSVHSMNVSTSLVWGSLR